MTPSDEIRVLQNLSQQAAGWLADVSPRSLRDWEAAGLPRNADGTYDAREVIAFLRRRRPDPPGLVAMLKETLAQDGPVGVARDVLLLTEESP
jgi:hypothetical protein